jgi:IclR family KDG regulon transcriptional repressor
LSGFPKASDALIIAGDFRIFDLTTSARERYVFYMSTTSSKRIQPKEGVRSLSTPLKTLQLLDYLATKRQSVRISEAAEELGAGRATIYQRLVTLVEAGWVEQLADTSFRLSLKAVGIGGAALEQANLGERTVPFLKELAAEVNETASLAVLQGASPYIVQRAEAGGLLQARQPVGSGFALHSSASGRVLVAFADPHMLRYLKANAKKLPDAKTLEAARRDGYAFSEDGTDVLALAAPVFDRGDTCIAALSLVGPSSRINGASLVEPLKRMAARLSAALQGRDR